METKWIIFIFGILVYISIVLWLFLSIARSAAKFHKRANDLEKKVILSGTTQEEYEKLYHEIASLAKNSFHHNTTSRIREIAKMMEIKFDVKILKR